MQDSVCRMEAENFFVLAQVTCKRRTRSSYRPSKYFESAESMYLHSYVMYMSMYHAILGILEPEAWRYALREWWCFPRQKVFWNSIHCRLQSEARLENQHKLIFAYRMSYESFHLLLGIVIPHLPCSSQEPAVRNPISRELALATVLWRLAQGHSSKTIFVLFGISESTIRKYMLIICRILSSDSMYQRV